MSKDKFKEQFASATAAAFRDVYREAYEATGDEQVFSASFIYDNLEKPKDPEMGRFAFPVFKYVRLLQAKPPEIASKIAARTNEIARTSSGSQTLLESTAIGGFLNARVDFLALAKETIPEVLTSGSHYGDSQIGRNRKYLVEYSSPNIAKPFGVAHLRTTVIGNSLRKFYKKLGYDVVGINYLGDWGTQFGKMIVAFQRWGSGVTLEKDAVSKLLELYIRFHEEAEQDPSLDEEARLTFRKLEEGDETIRQVWEKFRTISIAEFDRIYGILGVEYDFVTGESFLNDKMDAVIERLDRAGLTRVSEGALVVDMSDPQLPPCLLKKADGATLYATRDLAGLIYRWDRWRFHESLYVVAASQADHFKQCFKVIELMEDAECLDQEKRMTGRVKHIGFGWVKFGDRTMSTRRGNIVLLQDVIDKAIALAKEKIRQKNPSLEKTDETARMIAVGAVIFSQLSVKRLKDVNFIWEEVLSFEGETGPYLQYTHARLCSLLRNSRDDVTSDIDVSLLDREEERRVVEFIADFPGVVQDAARSYDPHLMAAYLLRLAGAFNRVYQRKDDKGRIDKIISDDRALSAARMALVRSVQIVVKEGLCLLGLQAPEEM